MKIFRHVLFACVAIMSIASCSAQKKESAKNQKKKIVLIPGTDSHGVGEHEHLGGCILLAKLLNEKVPGVEAVVTEQGWPKDTTILNDAATIVMYSDGGPGHMVIPHMAHISKLMEKGTGLVNIHYAVEIPKGEGGDNFLKWTGGYFETDYSVNPIWKATYDHFPNHPVTRGVKPFTVEDEWYYHMRFVENDKNLVRILETLPPPSSLERPEGPHENNPYVREDVLVKKLPQTMAWAYSRPDGGRGFGFTGAHYFKNFMNDDFRKIIVNAIVWTAKMNVPANGVDTPAPSPQELISLQKKEEK
jgi:type 1 glutamine amidotransferase